MVRAFDFRVNSLLPTSPCLGFRVGDWTMRPAIPIVGFANDNVPDNHFAILGQDHTNAWPSESTKGARIELHAVYLGNESFFVLSAALANFCAWN